MTPAPEAHGDPPAELLARALSDAFDGAVPGALGVAVSAGGDSTALTLLLAQWAKARGVRVHAVTVDHGLRPGSAGEARQAARLCGEFGLPHDTLVWEGWSGHGNLQDMARRARARLIAEWAATRGVDGVCLGHTRDDQAETVLLRLARGSGVDGLSGMAATRRAQGVLWLRPLLSVSRAALRDVLRTRGIGWVEDPSNDDPRFDRIKARRALATLEPLGLSAAGLAATAARMRTAREALAMAAANAARRIASVAQADVMIGRDGLLAEPAETRERLLAGSLRWVAGAAYPPRRAALQRLIEGLRAGHGGTLHGCAVTLRDGTLRISREWQAVRNLRVAPGEIWDGRWRLTGPEAGAGLHVGALGPEGLAALARIARAAPDAGVTGAAGAGEGEQAKAAHGVVAGARAAMLATPAVWRGAELVAAPLAGYGHGWHAECLRRAADFHASLLSH